MSAHEKQIGGDHYKRMAIQPSHYIVKNKLGWYEGNIVKYITRHSIKGGSRMWKKLSTMLNFCLRIYILSLKEKYEEK